MMRSSNTLRASSAMRLRWWHDLFSPYILSSVWYEIAQQSRSTHTHTHAFSRYAGKYRDHWWWGSPVCSLTWILLDDRLSYPSVQWSQTLLAPISADLVVSIQHPITIQVTTSIIFASPFFPRKGARGRGKAWLNLLPNARHFPYS